MTPEQPTKFRLLILTPIALILTLIYCRFAFGVLAFHTFAEFFAIIVGVLMFVVVWNARHFSQNYFLTYLGIGYFWIAVLDTYHTFTMTGMSLFNNDNFEVTIHFWVYTRILEALILLTAVRYLEKPFNSPRTFMIFGAIAVVIISLSFHLHEPQFMSEDGLTPAKIIAELFVISVLLITIVLYHKNRRLFVPKVLNYLYASLVMTIAAEVCFIIFTGIDHPAFVIGHLFKFMSFWMIYKAIIEISLKEPFAMMSKAFNSYDSIPHPSVVIDNDGLISRVNRAASLLSGEPAVNLVGKSVHDYFHPQTISQENCPLCAALANQESVSGELLYYPEYDRWFLYSLAQVTSGDMVMGMVQTLTDVTTSKQFEEELHDQKEQLRIMFETTTVGLALCKMDGTIVKVNDAFAKIMGRDVEETLTLSYWEITPERYATSEKAQLDSLAEHGTDGPYVKEYIHKKGHLVPVELKGCLLKQGDEDYIWSVVEDITDRQDAERRLRRSEKMDAIGQLSGGIAHDFNNILGVILGNIEIIKVKASLQPEIQKYLSSIEKAGQRAANLTSQLLDYSRKKADRLELVHIGELVTKMQNLIERSLTPDINVTIDIDEQLDIVEIASGDFQDALLNLIINSRDAMNGRGKLIISAENVELDDEFCRDYPRANAGKYVQLTISDDGQGITEEEISHIFEPFYTTKTQEEGTGLGLAMVFSFIKRIRGIITCDSVPSEGTTFTIYIPVSESRDLERNVAKPISVKQGDNETILVVDDEEALLRLTVEQLEMLNYRVLATTNADEALTLVKEDPEIRLLLSDIVMPGGINGYELANKARLIKPELEILLCSGYTNEKIKNAQTIKLDHPILKKPYNHTELANVLHNVLNDSEDN